MTLGELIALLESCDPTIVVPVGFNHPHSYRGYYDELAFEPAKDVTIADMLKDAKSALGRTFTAYKGGEFVMTDYTQVWLAWYGKTGESIGPILLSYMLGNPMALRPTREG